MTTPFASFDPNGQKEDSQSDRNYKRVPLRLILPNVVTLLAMCAGLTAIRFAFEENWWWALAAIVFAAFLDGIDGRVARFLKGTSKFGAELDSFSDFLSFGVAPALILYLWILDRIPTLGWIAAMIYAICNALRLARFNLSIGEKKKEGWRLYFLVGVPAPSGALVVLLPVTLYLIGLVPQQQYVAFGVICYTVFISLLMVSRIPTYSGKTLGSKVRRDFVFPILVGFVIYVALTVSFPVTMLASLTTLYLFSIPFACRSWIWHKRQENEEQNSVEANFDN